MPAVRVDALFEGQEGRETALGLQLVAGQRGTFRSITGARVQKPALALTGYTAYVNPNRLQVLGLTELSYFKTLSDEQRQKGARALCGILPAAIVVTRGLEVPSELIEEAEGQGVALYSSHLVSSLFIQRVQKLLDDRLSLTSSIHGVLIDVLGVGILILGQSGIGKSEAALDLILRGHRLVADDVVELRQHKDTIYGSGAEIIKHHMEIRGLGIINIKDLFGIAAVRDVKKVEVVIELCDWNETDDYDRLGVDDLYYELLGQRVPMLRVPIRPGRNIASIIEVAARNTLLKLQGKHSAREFQERLNQALLAVRPDEGPPRGDEVE